MVKLIQYLYYRISKWYYAMEIFHQGAHILCGGLYTGFLIGSIIVSILMVLCHVLGIHPNVFHDHPTYCIATIALIGSLLANEKNYNRLYEEYKNERNKTLKGWLVFGFAILSLVIYIISLGLSE